MKYIANIISPVKVTAFSELVNITSDASFCDYSLPTLIVGWGEAKRRFPNANILNKHITDTVQWTFLPRERKWEYEKDYEDFKEKVIKFYAKQLEYQYFSFFTEPMNNCKKVLKFIKTGKPILFCNRDMLYMLYGKKIIGFSLRDSDYMGIPREKVMKYISKCKIIYGNDFLSKKDKRVFYNNNIIVPYLYSLTV